MKTDTDIDDPIDVSVQPTGTELARSKGNLPANVAGSASQSEPSILSLLNNAVANGASVEALSQLMDLQERYQKMQAEREFNEAVTQFQRICAVVGHDRIADTGKFKYTYASLAHVADAIREPLSECGLTYSFDSDTTGNQMKVTCTIHHSAGHKRSSVFSCPIDTGAKQMNVMQQGASALSYARRYALLLALGLSTASEDDDARTAVPPRANAGSPKAPTRSERITSKDLTALYKRWEREVGAFGDEDESAAFRKFVNKACGLPMDDSIKNAANWSRSHVDKCHRAIEDWLGMPADTEVLPQE